MGCYGFINILIYHGCISIETILYIYIAMGSMSLCIDVCHKELTTPGMHIHIAFY